MIDLSKEFLFNTTLQMTIGSVFFVVEFFILAMAAGAFWQTRKKDKLQLAIGLVIMAISLQFLWQSVTIQLFRFYSYTLIIQNYVIHLLVVLAMIYVIAQLKKAKRKSR